MIGGSDFLGNHIADELSFRNHMVMIFDVKTSVWASGTQNIVVGDMSNQDLLETEIKKTDVVHHMAGIADIAVAENNLLETIQESIIGSAKIISLCVIYSVRFMYGSIMYVYSNHGSFYRASKQAVETLIEVFREKNGLEYTILRLGSLYGPRAQPWNGLRRIVSRMLNNRKIEFGGTGKEKREYIHVTDAAKMSVDLLDNSYLQKGMTLTGIQVLT